MKHYLTGADIIARAAIDAGCDFFAGYPITPASGILAAMLHELPKSHGIGVQGEDEIASIGFCLGAAAAGKRAMTATSGPGLSLYSEQLGFGLMAELPLVIVVVQRMGPATGGATTNAEGDVQFARWGTSGGYPMVVRCPVDIEDAYLQTIEAFNLAATLRTPVILLTSKDLVMSRQTVDPARLVKPEKVDVVLADPKDSGFLPYRRKHSEDVPPFASVGGDLLTRINTSTHGENGLLVKEPKLAGEALNHLRDKILSRADLIESVEANLEGGAETCIVAYGGPARVSREAVRLARKKGKKVSLILVRSLWPVPEKALRRLVGAHAKILVPELNHGQYLREIERLFPDKDIDSLQSIDGKGIAPGRIVERV